jgi:xylulokinase
VSLVALGIDIGTSSTKAVVVDLDGQVRGRASATYPVVSARPGWAETDPQLWWEAVRTCVAKAVPSAGAQPLAIGLSGQMHGLVLVDESLTPVRPAMLWADGRAIDQVDAYRQLDAGLTARLANPLVPGMAGPMLAWLQEHEPDVVARARWALQPKDWLRAVLTGEVAAEPSDASATLLYDVAGDRWDDELVSALGLRRGLLPTVLDRSAAVGGRLTRRAATALRLREGIPVAAGAADTAAAALGNGAVGPSDVQLTIGTGAQVVRPLTEPVDRAAAGVHLYRSTAARGWYHMGATTNAGIALNWVRETLDAGWEELYASLDDGMQPDDPIFVPHLTGERTPYLDPGLRASWTGLSLAHDRCALLRSALEGVAFAVAEALDALLGAFRPAHLRLAGGGTLAPQWRQLVSDVVGLPLLTTETTDASGRGAALLGAVAADRLSFDDVAGQLAPTGRITVEPRTDRSGPLDERRHRFRQTIEEMVTV